jgi:hypothetical protein
MKALQLLFLAAALMIVAAGCKTTEPENVAERPWNSQRGWEHGLPSNINQGR